MPPAFKKYLVQNSILDELMRRGFTIVGEPHFDRFVLIFLYFAFTFVLVLLLVLYLTWLERKFLARLQGRIGPDRVGPWGLLQPWADLFKFLRKQDIVPYVVDRWPHLLASVAVFIPIWVAFSFIPLGKVGNYQVLDPVTGEQVLDLATGLPKVEGIYLVGKDVGAGLIIVLALAAINMTGLIMAGWGSNNKYSMLGALRAIAVLISYEIPMLTVLLAVGVSASSFSLTDIVEAQERIWFLVPQIFGAFVFFCAILAEDSRHPFDLPQAESELAAGYHTEYSGIRFALFYLAEYAQILIFSALFVICFLGGWLSPFRHIPGIEQFALPDNLMIVSTTFWFMFKLILVTMLFFWLRGSLPRFRVDQLMDYSWKFLLPLSLYNLILVGLAVAYRHPWYVGNMEVINPISDLKDQVPVPTPWGAYQLYRPELIVDELRRASDFYNFAELTFHTLYWIGFFIMVGFFAVLIYRVAKKRAARRRRYRELVMRKKEAPQT